MEIHTQNLDALRILQKPASKFCYRPLDHVKREDIRLVCLMPGNYQDGLCCVLLHASLESGIKYEAVSYTWATEDGDESLSQSIICGYLGEALQRNIWITVNCESALRRLRHVSERRILWIDMIAIDQSNFEERNQQVAFMAQIYSHARQVLVYLGEEDIGLDANGLWQDSEKRTVALKKLFAKRWASRVWVIQEVALARELKMITGDKIIPMTSDFMNRVRGRARASGLHVPGPLAWDPVVSAPSRDLLTMLHMSYSCLSTDPRDKVYGLLGLTGERLRNLIKVDYSRSVEEVLTRASATIIMFREDFEILVSAALTLSASHVDGYLPTWVPNWTEHSEEQAVTQFRNANIGPWRRLTKSGFLNNDADTEYPDWTKVVALPSIWLPGSGQKSFLTLRAHFIGIIDNTIQTPSGPHDSFSRDGVSAWEFREQLESLNSRDIAIDAWAPQYQWLTQGAHSKRFSERPDSGALTAYEKADIQSFCDELARLGENKCIFRAGQLPAITSSRFEQGDYVYAVDGCTIPLILRLMSSEAVSKFRIVGIAYLLSLAHFDCWITSGLDHNQQRDFDPFRLMNAQTTKIIEIY